MSGTLNLRYRAEPQKINLFDEIRFPKSCYCAFASASMSGFCVAAHHIDGGLMPLTRSKEQILTTMNGVNFLMEDGHAGATWGQVRKRLACRRYGATVPIFLQ
jgi:hypothetical protein